METTTSQVGLFDLCWSDQTDGARPALLFPPASSISSLFSVFQDTTRVLFCSIHSL